MSRFDIYARRVRVLSGDYLLPGVHLTPFASAYLATLRRPLLPGLQKIRINRLYEDQREIILLLYSAKLKIVKLYIRDEGGDKDGHMMGTFLQSLRACAGDETHGLKKLCITPTAHRTHVDFIAKFDMLQDVNLGFGDRTTGEQLVEGFSKISALNRMSRLRVNWEADSGHHSLISPLLPPHSVNFISLHSIKIMAPTYIALLLVQCLRADTLKSIQIDCLLSPVNQPTAPRRLVKECGLVAPGLKEVGLQFHTDQPADQATFDAVLDLTQHFHLRTLKLKWAGPEIDDDNINRACLSRCFSHLEVLHLATCRPVPHTTLAFQILRSLATYCPFLKDLNLTLAVEEQHLLLLMKEIENEYSLSHGLKRLAIRLEDKPETATFLANGESIPVVSLYLDSLFPSLDHCLIYGPCPSHVLEKGIRLILKGLQRRSIVDSRRLVGSQVTSLQD